MSDEADPQETSAAMASLTGVHCADCAVTAPTLLVRTPEPFSARPVAIDRIATVADALDRGTGATHSTSRQPSDTSPPPGISPLRI